MSEITNEEITLKEELRALTQEQIHSVNWTEEKRQRLLAVKRELGIDQPPLTQEQRNALHRQGLADTESHPPLTPKEKVLIVEANILSSKSSR